MFPFAEPIHIKNNLSASSAQVLKHIAPLLTSERLQKIERVVDSRCFSQSIVLENIYDRGNASAVMRSAEALGLTSVHLIELSEKLKESQRTTAGADKWVEVTRWKSTADCVQELKKQGKQIVVTHLSAQSKPIAEIDFSKPTALVLGNEKDGASPEMVKAADHCVILPMVGFVQSYNISVAAALCFYHLYQDRLRRLGQHSDLSPEQKNILKAIYCLRTQDSAAEYLQELKARNEL